MQRIRQDWTEDDRPFSEWIALMTEGDGQAVANLWEPCFALLLRFARRQMRLPLRAVADEEDVALTAFFEVWQRAVRQQLGGLKDRHDLWKLLWAIARNKVAEHHRYFTREKRLAFAVPPEFLDDCLGEDDAAVSTLAGELRDCLPFSLRPVAELLLTGTTDDEIAEQLQISPRSLRRHVQEIRECWSTFLHDAA